MTDGVPAPDDVLGSSRDGNDVGLLDRVPRPWRVLGVAALVLVAAALLRPDLVSSTGGATSAPDADRRASTAPTRPSPAVTAPPAADLPVGGDLADDTEFVDAALRRVRAGFPAADRVLYAGSLPGGGRVAFVGRDRDESEGIRALDVYALRVRPGASVEVAEVTVVGRGLIEAERL